MPQEEMAKLLGASNACKGSPEEQGYTTASGPLIPVQTWLAFVRRKLDAQTQGMVDRTTFRVLDQGCWGCVTLDDFLRIVAAVAPGVSEQAARDAFAGLAGLAGQHVSWERWLELMLIARNAAI